jgi:outer membrane protein TolC
MRSSVARRPRRMVRLVVPVSALVVTAMASGSAQTPAPRPATPTATQPATPPARQPAPAPPTAGQPGARIVPVGEAVPGTPQGAAVEAPPVITFSPEGVSLEEALRLTLRHSTDVQLSAAEADRLAGFAQEQAGIFDTTITGGVEYSYRVQELTESRKADERGKREKLENFINTARPDVNRARDLRDLLRQVSSADGPSQAQQNRINELSPTLAQQLALFDTLIRTNSGQALADLRRIRTEFIDTARAGFEQNFIEQERGLRIAEKNFADLGPAPTDEVFENSRAKLQFSKLFHNGIQVAPFTDFTSEGSNFKDKERKAEFGGKGLNDLYTWRVGSDFLLPLMRGRGGDNVAARERAATIEAQAGTLEVEHQRAASVLRTAQAYWELRAAQEALAILERSASRHAELLKSTQGLVKGGELAEVEVLRSQAGEARARSRVLDARQRLVDARVELASALGIATSGADTTLPTAARDPFPAAPEAAALQPWVGATAASGQRRDLEAATRREEASQILHRGAQGDLRSKLDLTASLFYTALGEVGDRATEEEDANGLPLKDEFERPIYVRDGYMEAFDRWVGPSFTVTMQYEKPLGNNSAKGRLAARDAERRQRAIQAADVKRQVRLGVGRTAAALLETIGRLQRTQEASRAYDQTITSELARFRAGEATLINTIQTEQQATETDLSLIAAQQAVANLLAQLRFETGTMVNNAAVTAPTLLTLPNASGRGR